MTRFHHPLDLQITWDVGVESRLYASHVTHFGKGRGIISYSKILRGVGKNMEILKYMFAKQLRDIKLRAHEQSYSITIVKPGK